MGLVDLVNMAKNSNLTPMQKIIMNGVFFMLFNNAMFRFEKSINELTQE